MDASFLVGLLNRQFLAFDAPDLAVGQFLLTRINRDAATLSWNPDGTGDVDARVLLTIGTGQSISASRTIIF